MIEHFQDELIAAEHEFFSVYTNDDIRKNIHDAIAYLMGDYGEDIEQFRSDLGYVASTLLERIIADNPSNRVAYLEIQKYLGQSIKLLDDITPESGLIDRLSESRELSYPPEVPDSYMMYDPAITPKLVFHRKFPMYEFSTEQLREFRRIHQVRRAEVGND